MDLRFAHAGDWHWVTLGTGAPVGAAGWGVTNTWAL